MGIKNLLWDGGKISLYTGTLSPVALPLFERQGGFGGFCQFTKLTCTFTSIQGVRGVCTGSIPHAQIEHH